MSAVVPDSRSLRGLAHPLRVRLLGLLREHGPATATQLAARSGESSGATSYHLRQLAAYGFIEEDGERGTTRERYWRAVHSATHFSPPDDPEGHELGVEYLRAVAENYAERVRRFPDSLARLGADRQAAWTLSDWPLDLSAAESRQLLEELQAVIGRYPRAEPGGTRDRVTLQIQLLPSE